MKSSDLLELGLITTFRHIWNIFADIFMPGVVKKEGGEWPEPKTSISLEQCSEIPNMNCIRAKRYYLPGFWVNLNVKRLKML